MDPNYFRFLPLLPTSTNIAQQKMAQQERNGNVRDLKFREAKPSQGNPPVSVDKDLK